MSKFYIDEQYLTSVTNRRVEILKPTSGTDEDAVVDILTNGYRVSTSISSSDHPEFTKLRQQLSDSGYIRIERGWWNGDVVLKKFSLNNHVFRVDDSFLSGVALGIRFKTERIRKNETNCNS